MTKTFSIPCKPLLLAALLLLFCITGQAPTIVWAQPEKGTEKPGTAPAVLFLPEGTEKAVEKKAEERKNIEARVRQLLRPEPLNFDMDTARRVWRVTLSLPSRLPLFVQYVREQGRVLGLLGSLLILFFFLLLLYSIIGRKKALQWIEVTMEPIKEHVPEFFHPYFLSFARVLATSLIPLFLLGMFTLIQAFLPYEANWLLLAGRLLGLWVIGAVMLNLMRESLTRDHIPIQRSYGLSIFRVARFVSLYILISMALFWGIEAFHIPEDILALLKFLISLSVVFAILLLLLKKKSILGILPELPYRTYRVVIQALERLYYPAIILSFLTGLLWCFGYHALCTAIWRKTWAVVGAFIGIMVFYHLINQKINQWIAAKPVTDEAAKFFHRALRSLLLYGAVASVALVTLNLLGFLSPLSRVMSFPVAVVGETPLSLWIFVKAALIILGFFLFSRLLRAWLDYKVYPTIGVEEGIAYAINTFLNYFFLAVGFLYAMRAVGLDLRVLMVLAGAVGIGIGLGLQNMAANLLSSFILVFGRRIKKGDWIQVGETLGAVREVGLASTRVWTRDNIEYLVPNADLTSGMIVNYSLSDPLIRIHVPVGVAYNSDPRQVTEILRKAAGENPHVSKERETGVWLMEYADSSVNFELLVWIDVRKVSEEAVRSEIYYAIFQAFTDQGIEIPFPQRDVHIRSGLPTPKNTTPEGQV